MLSSQPGEQSTWRHQSLPPPLPRPAPPGSSPCLHHYFFYSSRIRKRRGNFPAAAVADFSGLCVQCACVFPPLITVLPTDNLAITSQGGSMELMLKLGFFFVFFLLFKLQCVMRQRGRREGEGSHKFCGWCSCSLSSREASDVSTALSLTFKLRVCFPVCFIGRDLSWPVTCSNPPHPTPTASV